MSHIIYTDMRPPRTITPPRAAVKRRAELHDRNDTLQKRPRQARADWQYPTFAVTAPSTQPAYCPQEVEPTRPPPNRNELQGSPSYSQAPAAQSHLPSYGVDPPTIGPYRDQGVSSASTCPDTGRNEGAQDGIPSYNVHPPRRHRSAYHSSYEYHPYDLRGRTKSVYQARQSYRDQEPLPQPSPAIMDTQDDPGVECDAESSSEAGTSYQLKPQHHVDYPADDDIDLDEPETSNANASAEMRNLDDDEYMYAEERIQIHAYDEEEEWIDDEDKMKSDGVAYDPDAMAETEAEHTSEDEYYPRNAIPPPSPRRAVSPASIHHRRLHSPFSHRPRLPSGASHNAYGEPPSPPSSPRQPREYAGGRGAFQHRAQAGSNHNAYRAPPPPVSSSRQSMRDERSHISPMYRAPPPPTYRAPPPPPSLPYPRRCREPRTPPYPPTYRAPPPPMYRAPPPTF
ncbi:hypothetical protein M422DRAFT_274230, partial [Sphaerobolus stellatus SS14]